MSFKYPLSAAVKIGISGEAGQVKGRADYVSAGNQYYVHYLAADGRAVNAWFDEDEIQPVSEMPTA